MRLTALQIDQLPTPAKGQKTYWDGEGFGVRVSQGGTKSFVVMYGTDRRLKTLGRYPTMTLKQARAAALTTKLTDTPQTRLDSLTEARTAFLRDCATRLRPATINQYTFYLEKTAQTSLATITKQTITDHTPHCIASWKAFFNWCIRQQLVDRNPFAFEVVRYGRRDRVLTNDELRLLWQYEYPPYSDYIKLLMLTGQRSGQFKDYTCSNGALVFPASVMKNKDTHTIPATPQVQALLARLQPFNGWSKAKVRADKQTGVTNYVLHDLRRTFSTINASLGTPIHVTEHILAHTTGSRGPVERIYNRHSYMIEMQTALDSYQKHLQTIVT